MWDQIHLFQQSAIIESKANAAEPLADCRTRPPFVMMALIQSVLTKAVPYGMMTKAAGLEEDQQVKEKSPSEIPCHRNQQKVLMKQ